MPFFTTPTSYRNANPVAPFSRFEFEFQAMSAHLSPNRVFPQLSMSSSQRPLLPPHSSHPNFGHLTLLVFEAVLEVVCVSLPGYIVARQGMFNEEMQKFIANLNILLFTPCLSTLSIHLRGSSPGLTSEIVFIKLGSQLTADKLADLAVIPIIFAVQVVVSYLCSLIVAKAFGFAKRPRNFVIAMGVCIPLHLATSPWLGIKLSQS